MNVYMSLKVWMNMNTDTVGEDFHLTNNRKTKIPPQTHAETLSNRASHSFIEGIILPGLILVALIPRITSLLSGTALIMVIYWLGRAPFGRLVALLAALCLALSPWLVYFSALAYLDMTMTTLITIAYLVLWPAIRQPRLYLLSAMLLG